MKMLITGACGFLGSHIVEHARKTWRGDIVAVSNYHASGRTGWVQGADVVRHDIRDTSAIASYKPDIIINAAARTSVPYSYDAPFDNWDVNANAVARMLYALPKTRFIQVSTSEVFSGRNPPYFDHSMPCPLTPYGASKAAAEGVARATGNTIVRVFNLFGPRQSPRTIIPRMLLQAWEIKRGQRAKASLYGPNDRMGEPYSRAFLYVDDIARIIATQVIDDTRPLVQLACDQPRKIADLWVMCAGVVGVDPSLIEWTELPPNASSVSRLYGRSSEGYAPKRLDAGTLAETAAWYGEHAGAFERLIYD